MGAKDIVFQIINGVTTYKDDQGRIHNDDGPAVIYSASGIEHYYKHGFLHRLDGPAIVHKDDPTKCTYAVDGIVCDKSVFQQRVEKYISEQIDLEDTEPVNMAENMYLEIPDHPEISFVIIVENGMVLSCYSIHDPETKERLYAEQSYIVSGTKSHLLKRIEHAIYESDCLNWFESDKTTKELPKPPNHNTDWCHICGVPIDSDDMFTFYQVPMCQHCSMGFMG